MMSNSYQHLIFFRERNSFLLFAPFYAVHTVCSDDPGLSICSQLPTYGNFCTEHFNWTVKHCPKSCGFCGGRVVETFPFLEFIVITFFFKIILCMPRWINVTNAYPFKKQKNAFNLIFKMLLCSSPGYRETCHHGHAF